MITEGHSTSERLSDMLRRHEADRAAREDGLSRFELQGELGRGGIAVVYRARDLKLGREVAVKKLQSHLEASGEARARFQREGKAAARLAHPNIVTVHDAGEDRGQLFLVMELVPGESLQRVLAGRRYELGKRVELLEKVAFAVQYAHDQGVVHRDLKPSNILVLPSGDPKVADFGLAHLLVHETAISRTGSAVGTPLYMAPEQVIGGEITSRTDVYALGAILYEITTGRPPHTGDSVSEVFGQVLHEDPVPPRLLNRHVSRDLEIITLKALEKDPARRYESAQAFAEDLRCFLERRPIHAHPPGLWTKFRKRVRRRPVFWAVSCVVAIAGGIGLSVFLGTRIRHAWAVAEKRSEAQKAEAEGRILEAADLYSRLRELAPNDVEAAERAVALRTRALEEDRKKRAHALVETAQQLRREDLPRTAREHEQLSARAWAVLHEIPFWAQPEEKRTIWNHDRKVESLQRELVRLRAKLLDDLTSAYYLAPDDPKVLTAYLEEGWHRLTEAEESGEESASTYWSDRIRAVGHPEWIARLDAGGRLRWQSEPAGAEGYLFHYEENWDRRLLPRPFHPQRGKPMDVWGMECSEFNKLTSPDLALPRGSYLLLLRREGFVDVRYPVLIERYTDHQAMVRLYTSGEIGEGFVYVPAGKFVMGGDPNAYLSGKRNPRAYTDGFFIGRFEVTLREYLPFLNEVLAREGREAAQKLVPRREKGVGYFWEIPEGAKEAHLPEGWREEWPAFGLSWFDADAYCRWRTRTSGGKVAYRLPTNVEWEKAARGADGRFYPWGNHFDWSFTKGGASRPGKPEIEEVGTFEKDESPYGVRDLPGSVKEWCERKEGEPLPHVHLRGGAFDLGGISSFPVSARLWVEPESVSIRRGLRIVRMLEK